MRPAATSSSSEEAHGVVEYVIDDWIRSNRSAATMANRSHIGSGVPPPNMPSSSAQS